VQVRVRLGALALLATIAWLLATQLLPAAEPGIGGVPAWALGLTGAILVEAGVVLHEVGHAVAARGAGLRADVSELRLLGGVTEIVGDVRRPGDQLRIAGIGPAVSLGYGALFAVLTALGRLAGGPSAVVALGVYVTVASAVIGVVNLLPGAPLDGGRLLHAWWWQRCGDRHRAGLAAARAGRWVAVLVLVAGIALTIRGMVGLLGGASVEAMGAVTWFGARQEGRELTRSGGPEPERAQQR
jgi:Zn-dependent protease